MMTSVSRSSILGWLVGVRGFIRLPLLGHLVLGASFAAAQTPTTPAPDAPRVSVNRTRPAVTPPTGVPVFSAAPTDAEITRARVFSGALLPTGPTTTEENRALADLILAYRRAAAPDAVAGFEEFLGDHPESGWQASLRVNLGRVARAQGALSSALAYWSDAWQATKDASSVSGQRVAAEALGETLAFASDLGSVTLLRHWLDVGSGRSLSGQPAERVARARSVLALLEQHPERAVLCGRQAIAGLWGLVDGRPVPAVLTTGGGTERSLAQLVALAGEQGLDLEAVRMPADAEPVAPALVHFTIGHYVLLVRTDGQRYLVRDPGLGGETWITREAFQREASGYGLVPRGRRPATWAAVTPEEAAGVVGDSTCPSGPPTTNDPPGCPRNSSTGASGPRGGSGCGASCGMPTYAFEMVDAALLLTDTPVGYAPPVGPDVFFTLRYDARQHLQPDVRTYGHVGAQWTHDWLSFVAEVPEYCEDGGSITNYCYPARANVYLRGGGQEEFTGEDANEVYPAHWRERAQLVRTSSDPIRYERRLADGGVEVFAQPDTAPAGSRRIFLTEVRDAHGQAVTLTYDAEYRLVALTDALGQVTTLGYADAADPLRLTDVTDAYGRSAHVTYTDAGQLETITDVLGLTSRVRYGDADTIVSLTTPYGVTTFRHGMDAYYPTIEATDPLGGTERAEYQWDISGWPETEPAGEVPAGFEARNAQLNHYTTVYWDQRAWAAGPGSIASATLTRWLLWAWSPYATVDAVGIPHSVKRPLERRVWYAYPGQAATDGIGSTSQPSLTARVLDDATEQRSEATYNALGQITSRTDPVGRQTTYSYDTNGFDLLEVRQVKPGGTDLLAQYGNYTAGHQPQTVTDAAGQTTTFTYNAFGEVLTAADAKQETTTSVYDTDGRLQSVTGPATGATTTYTYDAYGRVRTVTGPDGYAVTTDYDLFDRPTRVTYPDGTYEETTYDRLDVKTRRDRLGRVTQYFHDELRRLRATRDPEGRTITQAWSLGNCTGCASRDTLTDAKGQTTTWERDMQGRVVRELRADGVTATFYAYEAASGRLHTVTDPKQQVTTYAYALDDSVIGMTYTNAAIATPSVSFTYDPVYNRVARMVDGTGSTSYTYHPAGELGAGQLASVDGPLTDDTMTYAYDELGRVTSRALNGAASTQTYDALGRVTTESNVLGPFSYGYVGVTGRLQLVTYPNGQASSYAYFDNVGDQRLQTMHHRKPDSSTLSKLDYTYDAAGNILTWQQQADSDAPTMWRYSYDRTDQLTSALHQTTGGTPTTIKRYGYAYDPAGNRTSAQIDDQVTGATHDTLNRLLRQTPGGMLTFQGTLNEPGRVTINGVAASVDATNQFRASVPVTAGTNTISITAVDASGNTSEAVYEVDQAGTSRSSTYDANGNLASKTQDGSTWTYEFDAVNRLTRVLLDAAEVARFSYDGLGRRTEKVAGGVTHRDVYDGPHVIEDRLSGGATGTIRYAVGPGIDNWLGRQNADESTTYFVADHLGSIVRETDSAGDVTLTRSYDPWGNLDATSAAVGGPAYTGRCWDPEIQLYDYRARSYDPSVGRFISEDPTGFGAGPDFYVYVQNRPSAARDPDGLDIRICTRGAFPNRLTGSVGNHAFLLDDRNGRNCGKGGGNWPNGGENLNNVGTFCIVVPGSKGLEDKVMECCKKKASSFAGRWIPMIPWVADCHNLARSCLKAAGLPDTAAPGGRIGCRGNCPAPAPYPAHERFMSGW